jgi:hypothetical protein
MAAPKSYKDPFWVDLAGSTEQRLGLPDGLLVAVLTKGERSNADQVSSAGARTPFQIIPATAKAAIKKYGIDPYLSPENAAEVAGRLLQDSLKRNQGDAAAAVGEYIGGTDRSAWGPQTRAYIKRVIGDDTAQSFAVPQQSTPIALPIPADFKTPGSSTFDRLMETMGKPAESAIANITKAYQAGQMAPDEAAQFESDVKSGRIMLPRGASLKLSGPSAAGTLPAGVLQAYSDGRMSAADKLQLEGDVRSGRVTLPTGIELGGGVARAAIPGGSSNVPPAPQLEPGLVDKAIGTGEAALNAISGATTGAVGMAGGLVAGLAKRAANGDLLNPNAPDLPAQYAQQASEAATYAPRTQSGQDRAAALGGAMQNLIPLAGIAGMMPPGAVAPAGALARTGAAAVLDKAATAVPAALREVPGKVASMMPGAAIEKSSAGTMGSAGAAAADMAAQRIATAESLPVPMRLTKGEATRDPAQVKFEEGAAKNMDVGQPLRERINENNQNLLRNFDVMVDLTGAEAPTLRATGGVVNQVLVKQAAADKAQVRSAYKAAEKAGELEAPVVLDSLVQHLNESAPDAATAPLLDVARARAIRLGLAIDDGAGNLVPQPVPLKIAETYRQAISRATDFEPTNMRQATIIKGLVDEATNGMGGSLYKDARAMRARYAQNYENHAVINQLLSMKRGTTDRAVALEDVFSHSILKGSLDDVRQVRRVLHRSGPDGQQAWHELQGATAGWIRDKATTTATDAAGTRVISPAAMDKAIRELDADGKLTFVFGKQGAQTIRDLRDVAMYVKTAPPEAAINYSNSAWTILGAFGDVASSALTGTPAPLMTMGRLGFKYVKDAKLRARMQEALNYAEKKQAVISKQNQKAP